jgi:hypothetical protein
MYIALIGLLGSLTEFTFLQLVHSKLSFIVSNLTDMANLGDDISVFNCFIAIFYAIYISAIGLLGILFILSNLSHVVKFLYDLHIFNGCTVICWMSCIF